jgi:hypothetical protein
MGGAGLAVIRRPTAQSFQNPAVIAYVQGFRFGAGNIDTTARGASFSRLLDDLEVRQGSAADIATAAGLLRKYAREDTRLLITGDLGIIASGVGIVRRRDCGRAAAAECTLAELGAHGWQSD